MEEMTYVGYRYGTFTDERGAAHDYCSVYMIAPMEGEQSDTCHFAGQAAIKYRATAPEVFLRPPLALAFVAISTVKTAWRLCRLSVNSVAARIDPSRRGGGR